MKIEGKILLPHIYVLSFETQYELCMSLVRMQEFYESPKFKGRYFTLEQYMDYWCKEFGDGAFTYTTTWNGFNLPGKVIYDWIQKFDEPYDRRKESCDGTKTLRDREVYFLKQIKKLMDKEMGFTLDDDLEKIYVIGTHKNDRAKDRRQVIEHELAHAMYYLYPEYRRGCKKLLKSISKREYWEVKNALIREGYVKNVIDDELQAYFSTENICEYGYVLKSKAEFVHHFNGFKEKIQKSEKNS
jgi:hypothetical protein